ncbi:MAG: diacylglycerol/lipid kinase family protein [Thermoanaerobaculia bacterium]
MPRLGAIFINAVSGTADGERAAAIREAATARRLDVLELDASLDVGAEVRARLDRGERLFVAAGGDGTVHTLLQPLVGSEGELGVVPVGTWNHFARDIGVPLDWREALEVAVAGDVRQIDAGRVNDRFFVNNISLGLYPELVRHRERFRRFGKWRAYWKAARAAMKKFPHVALVLETPHMMDAVRTHVFMVSVNPYDLTQPGVLAPRKTLSGGNLSVYWLPDMPKPQFVLTVGRYLRGKATSEGTIRSVQTTRVRVQSSHRTMRVGIDGELHDLDLPLTITILRQALTVRVPRDARV